MHLSQAGRGSPVADIPWGAERPSISRPRPGQPARLAFQTITRDVDIHMMDLEAELANATIQPFANSTRIEASARFSSDRARVAFVSWRSGDPEVWVALRDGSGLQQTTSLGVDQLLISEWSPEGTRILFDAAIGGNSDVYVVAAGGGRPRRLTSEPSTDGVPSWSGDGRWIYFSSTRGGVIPDVWRISADGGEARRITHNGAFEPRESPDGHFCFTSTGTRGRWRRRALPADAYAVVGGRRKSCSIAFGRFCGRLLTRESSSSPASRTSMRLMCTGSAISESPGWAGSDFGYHVPSRT